MTLHLPVPSRRALLTGSLALMAAAPLRGALFAGAPSEETLRTRIRSQFGEDGAARKRLRELAAAETLSGVVAIALGKDIVFREAYGMADRAKGIPNRFDTRFNLASMGKMFTALAIARLAEQGRLSWQDPVARHLPNLPQAWSGIAIDHLLSHRSGLGSYFASPLYAGKLAREGRTISDYMEVVLQDRPKSEPGSAYSYSNNGYVLLGAVIEQLTGKSYFQAVSDLVYSRAGMRHTAHTTLDELGPGDARGYTNGCFARPPSQCTAKPLDEVSGGGLRGTPAGGVYSNAPDLLRFSQALRAGKIVRPATLDLMTRRHVDGMPQGGPIDGYGYGFGLLRIGGHETFGHNGGTPGATSQLDMLPTPALTMLVLANADSGQRPVSGLLRRSLLVEA